LATAKPTALATAKPTVKPSFRSYKIINKFY
jgi:hypothetical protein